MHLRQQMFEFDYSSKDEDKDSYHFVAYVPINGRIYELDGLKDGPVDLGEMINDCMILIVIFAVVVSLLNVVELENL